MKWPPVKLKSVTSKVGSGATPRGGEAVYKDAGVPLIRSMNVHFDGFRRDGLVYIDEEEAFLLNHVEIQSDDVLFNITGASIGRVTTAPADMAGARVNQHVCILRPTDKLMPEFLSYYMRSPDQQVLVGNNQIGGTRQAVTKGMLLNWEIHLPPLAEQGRIVKLLNEADELRKLRTKADRRTADLIPSLFHEMFGDPAANEHKWNVVELIDVISKEKHSIKRGPFGGAIKKEIFVPKGFKIYEQKNAIRDDFEVGNYFIDESKFKELGSFSISPNDLIVSCSGTIGKVAIVPSSAKPGIINQALLKLRLDRRRALPIFFKYLLETDHMQRSLFGGAAGSAIKNVMPLEHIKRVQFPLPLLPLQNEFAARVSDIRAVQAEQSASRRRLDDLFQSLLHRAFKGEL